MEQPPGAADEPGLDSQDTSLKGARLRKASTFGGSSLTRDVRRKISARSRRSGIIVICAYIFWSFMIPIKNVLMIQNPTLRVDVIQTDTSSYIFDSDVRKSSRSEVSGHDLVAILQKVTDLVVGKKAIREQLEAVGVFDIDSIDHLLSPDEFQTISLYYSLIMQASEFPAGVFTPRPRHFVRTSGELPKDAVGAWILPTNGSDAWLLTVSCSVENAVMDGTRCFQNTTEYVCYDFPVAGAQRTYASVSLNASRSDSGFGNSIALMQIVVEFNTILTTLFATRNWNRTLDKLQFFASSSDALTNGFSNVYHDGIPLMTEKAALDSYSIRVQDLTTTTLESCFYSEIITAAFYVKAFVFDLVETALVEIPSLPYGASADNRLNIPRDRIQALLQPVLSKKVRITSGALANAALGRTETSIFTRYKLTSITRSTSRLKLDKKPQNLETIGSNPRMLLYMARYPEYYSRSQQTLVQDATTSHAYDAIQFTLLGGAMSGLNTFKGDWWGNTMGVFKLAEISRQPDDPRIDTWWDQEAKFAAWFQRLEQSDKAPFLSLGELIDIESLGVALDDNSITRCHRAFFKTLAKIVWLTLLSASAQPSYLVYMGNVNGGARPWFVSRMKKFELVGETMDGIRYPFTYASTTPHRKDDGSAWVMVPLVEALLENFGPNRTTEMVLAEYNASFPLLVTTEYGLVHFPDSSQCRVGFKTNNVSAETNTVDKITAKFYPSIEAFVKRAVDGHAKLYSKMSSELATQGVEMVHIPKEMIVGSPSAPVSIGYVGSPVQWKPTALTAGMLKFWPASTPPQPVIEAYRNATVCYRTLELKYLNESVRCWVEPSSITRSRTSYDSEGLRYMIWSNWSISWVLNCIAVVIAVQFLRRFVIAYKRTRFRCVSFWVAAQLNFQSIGVLTLSQVLLMTLSAVPILIAYHLPHDPNFMEQSPAVHYPKLIRECIVTLSTTWFIRLGFDMVNQSIELHEIHPWLTNFRPRAAALALVFCVRLATPDLTRDANYEISKLLVTCAVSVVLGMATALVPIYLHHRGRKISPTMSPSVSGIATRPHQAHVLIKAHNVVIKQLQKERMPVNHHGLLGFSRFYGWSLSALLVEGWEIVEFKSNSEVFITKGRCKVRLQVDDDGTITQCLL